MDANLGMLDKRFFWILASTAVLFSPALAFFFISDDFHLIETARNTPLWSLFARETYVYYRPLVLLSYAVEHALWGAGPLGYHETNILLHLLNTALVCLIARRLLGRESCAWVWAGLLFGITPTHASSVLWICGRTDLLWGTFFLVSVLTYLTSLDRNRPWLRAVSLPAFAGSLLSKEMAVSLPFLCLILGTVV